MSLLETHEACGGAGTGTVGNPPRMADFAHLLAAIDKVTGWDTLASYRAKVAALSPRL